MGEATAQGSSIYLTFAKPRFNSTLPLPLNTNRISIRSALSSGMLPWCTDYLLLRLSLFLEMSLLLSESTVATLALHGFLFAWHQASLPGLSAYLSDHQAEVSLLEKLDYTAPSFPWVMFNVYEIRFTFLICSLDMSCLLNSPLPSQPSVCENFAVLHLIPLLVF